MARTGIAALRLVALTALAPTLLASCGGAGAGSGSTPSPQRPGITGRWKGRLHQRGLAPFTVTASIRSLRASAPNTVAYSGIGCSGNWRYLGRRGSAFRFREVIRRGRGGTCKGVGTVTLTPAGAGRLRYRFQGGGVVSRGVLARADGG